MSARGDCPLFAAVVDEYRRVFGDVRVRWVVEDGKRFGRVPEAAQINAGDAQLRAEG